MQPIKSHKNIIIFMTGKNDCSIESIAQSMVALWEELTPSQYDLLTEHLDIRKFKKNEVIYKDYERPTKALCLIKGKVKIYKEGIGGKSQIIRVFKPIEFLGYRAYFAGENYKTSAMAIEACIIARFPINVLDKLIEENPCVSKYFIKNLSNILGLSDNRIVTLTQKHVRARISDTLLFLKDSYGLEADNHTLGICLRREDIANMSNMTTSNAIRTLSAFANEKLISINGRKIQILEEEMLRKISRQG